MKRELTREGGYESIREMSHVIYKDAGERERARDLFVTILTPVLDSENPDRIMSIAEAYIETLTVAAEFSNR